MKLPEVRGYVLAGGRSSRMGEDKARLRIGGRSLLEIAVGKLGEVCSEVSVVGGGETGLSGVKVIPDLRPGCGPMGGMEAALRDAGGSWAMFLPVDMPMVPVGLLRALRDRWTGGAEARVSFAEVDGRPQPLLSAMRAEVLPWLERSLSSGSYKVVPTLVEAGHGMAQERGLPVERVLERLEVRPAADLRDFYGWLSTGIDLATRAMWFANVNTPGEFQELEGYMAAGLPSNSRSTVE